MLHGFCSLQLLPTLTEGSCCRRWEVARACPTAPWAGQLTEPAVACKRPQGQPGAAQGQSIEPRPGKHAFPQPVGHPFPTVRFAVVLELAQANEHARYVDA